MIIDHPKESHVPALKALWREAFGDGEKVIDTFYAVAYSPERCFAVIDGDVPVAAAYFFRCASWGRPVAYIYAVAVARSRRRQGVCRLLMEEADRRLAAEGYAGALLVPADGGLFAMYERLGYSAPVYLSETFVTEEALVSLLGERISSEEYARLRREHLPDGGTVQEGESLAYLSASAEFYRTPSGVACVFKEEGRPVSAEVLGEDVSAAASADGTVKVRHPGTDKRFALYKSFDGTAAPAYLGIAFD